MARQQRTIDAQEKFLAALRQSPVIPDAARAAGVATSVHYHWLKMADYKAAFDAALAEGIRVACAAEDERRKQK